MKPKLLAAVVAGAALIAIAVPAAGGATPHRYSSAIVIDGYDSHYFLPSDGRQGKRAPNAFDFFGRIDSAKGKCKPNRGVTLYFKQSGADRKMGHATSDSNGGWSQMVLLEDFQSGTYYVKASRSKLGNGSICKADRSTDYATGSG
jgi:hypothetical protein